MHSLLLWISDKTGFEMTERLTWIIFCFSTGVSVLAVGVSNADIEELNKIAAPTSYKNIFYSPTFDDFPSIEREFIKSICSEELLSEFKLNDEARQKQRKTIACLFFSVFVGTLKIYFKQPCWEKIQTPYTNKCNVNNPLQWAQTRFVRVHMYSKCSC